MAGPDGPRQPGSASAELGRPTLAEGPAALDQVVGGPRPLERGPRLLVGGVHALFADGHVAVLSDTTDAALHRAVHSIDGGETVQAEF